MMSRSFLLEKKSIALAALLAGAGSIAVAAGPTGDPAFLPKGAKVEALVDGKKHDLFFTEGPVATCDGKVLFTDIPVTMFKKGPNGWDAPSGQIMKYDPATRAVSVFRSPSGMANGLRVDRDCNLVAAEGADHGGRRVTRTDMKTGRTAILTASYGGRPYNAPNDVAIDGKGRIYFSDPRYMGTEKVEQDVQAVYRIDKDGKVAQIVKDAAKPNGLALCPGDKHLFVVAHDNGTTDLAKAGDPATVKGPMAILQYDLDEQGNASNRRVLVDYAPADGPDSMTCDAEGNLWVAVRDARRPGVYAYRVSNGKAEERAYIPLPALPTNVGFGRGKNASYLYITAGNGLYGIRTGKKGHHPQ